LQTIKQGGGNFDNFELLLGNTNNDLAKIKQMLGVNASKRGKFFAGGKREPFPEDFVFRQNEFRSEDLEVEERALMNIAA
jgi:hypothetical protein